MTTVALIVTGRLELKALATSLARLFSGVEFIVEKENGFTSNRISLPLPEQQTDADKVARRLIAAVDPGRTGDPADFAMVVDDLELANHDQPDAVCEYFRHAVERQLDGYWPSAARLDRTRQRVRERCSFHLVVPMIEAYFYAEQEALRRAGARRPSRVDPGAIDLEDFRVDDAEFLAPATGTRWWANENRDRHPKHYLSFLCDPEGKGIHRYRETKGGAKALEKLDWRAVLEPDSSVMFVRSLIHDLATALDQVPALDQLPVPLSGTCHPLTELGAGTGLLRNV